MSIGLGKLPDVLNRRVIFGIGLLEGIGFMMTIFITLSAFDTGQFSNNAKQIPSFPFLFAGFLGYFALKITLNKEVVEEG